MNDNLKKPEAIKLIAETLLDVDIVNKQDLLSDIDSLLREEKL